MRVDSVGVDEKDNDGSIKMCGNVAGSSRVGGARTMDTENGVNYSMGTLDDPVGFYGMRLGGIKKER